MGSQYTLSVEILLERFGISSERTVKTNFGVSKFGWFVGPLGEILNQPLRDVN